MTFFVVWFVSFHRGLIVYVCVCVCVCVALQVPPRIIVSVCQT
jgi:hypothetical protein